LIQTTHGATTIREQLQKHRATPSGAACTQRWIRPDLRWKHLMSIGGLRSRYRSLGAGDFTSRVFPVAGGPFTRWPCPWTLRHAHRRHSFKDITGFREHLLANPDQIAENFAHHLLIYATVLISATATVRTWLNSLLIRKHTHASAISFTSLRRVICSSASDGSRLLHGETGLQPSWRHQCRCRR